MLQSVWHANPRQPNRLLNTILHCRIYQDGGLNRQHPTCTWRWDLDGLRQRLEGWTALRTNYRGCPNGEWLSLLHSQVCNSLEKLLFFSIRIYRFYSEVLLHEGNFQSLNSQTPLSSFFLSFFLSFFPSFLPSFLPLWSIAKSANFPVTWLKTRDLTSFRLLLARHTWSPMLASP